MAIKKTLYKFIKFVVIFSLIGAIFISWAFYAAIYKWRSSVQAEIEIVPGSSVQTISRQLAEQKVITTPKIFDVFARVRGVGQKMRAGEYVFPQGITLNEVMEKIIKGDVVKYQIKIIEGWTIADIASYLRKNPVIRNQAIVDRFESLTHDPVYIETLGFKGIKSLEGYLFSDTYNVLRPHKAEDLIERFVARFKEIYSDDFEKLTKERNLSQQEIITLASIIEKETGDVNERPLIASVFFNRLKDGMALQSDPTVIYGLKNFDGNLRKRDLGNPHPYNTYRHAGLPPGPICNPGKASIKAVFFPATTQYLYFVSKNDGTHFFSKTLAEHSKVVTNYQLKR